MAMHRSFGRARVIRHAVQVAAAVGGSLALAACAGAGGSPPASAGAPAAAWANLQSAAQLGGDAEIYCGGEPEAAHMLHAAYRLDVSDRRMRPVAGGARVALVLWMLPSAGQARACVRSFQHPETAFSGASPMHRRISTETIQTRRFKRGAPGAIPGSTGEYDTVVAYGRLLATGLSYNVPDSARVEADLRAVAHRVRPGAPPPATSVLFPALRSHGFAYQTRRGVTLTDDHRRVLARLPGWQLRGVSGMPAGALALHHWGRYWILDARRARLVAWSGDPNATPIAAGARLVFGQGRRWRVVIGRHAIWHGRSDATVSGDGRLVTAGATDHSTRLALDVTDRTRVRVPPGCVAGARQGPTWYLLCGAMTGPWVGALHAGRTRVLAPPLGKGARSGWTGSYTGAHLSPDGRTLLLQYSGQCEAPLALFAPTSGGRQRAVTGEADWRRAPESSGFEWTASGSALVRIYGPECGPGARPGVYLISPDGGRRRIARSTAVPWGRW